MKSNKGVTIIELIVVIAILGVLIGGVALTFSIVDSADIKGCTQTLDSSLEKAKNECMSKIDQSFLVLYKSTEDDYTGYYLGNVSRSDLATYLPSPESDRKVGNENIQINIDMANGTIDVSDTAVFFTFDRGSGAFDYVYKGIPATSTNQYPLSITITNGSRTNTINCIQATGKHFVE